MENAAAMMGSLKHVYFFLDRAQEKQPATEKQPAMTVDTNAAAAFSAVEREVASVTPVASTVTSISPSPSTRSGTSASNSTPLTPSAPTFEPHKNTALNPAIRSFIPSSDRPVPSVGPAPPAGPPFEIREAPDKSGLGIFATRFIRAGTRLILEPPILKIERNELHLVCQQYRQLSPEKKAIYDQLHAFQPHNLDFDQAARSFLIHYGQNRRQSSASPTKSEADFEQDVATYIKAMAIFGANNFMLGNGESHGVFPTVSRVNHSCVPNVHYTNHGKGEKQRVHTIRDINAGEELVANYLGAKGAYWPRQPRMDELFHSHGFVCRCPACSSPTGDSDARRMLLHNIMLGLNQYQEGARRQSAEEVFIPESDVMALVQAEDGMRLLREEGLFTMELCKALRMASGLAVALREYEKALGYALEEEDIEHKILGEEIDDLVLLGTASKLWISRIQELMAGDDIRLPRAFWDLFSSRTQRRFRPKSPNTQQHPKKKNNFHGKKNRFRAKKALHARGGSQAGATAPTGEIRETVPAGETSQAGDANQCA